MSTSYGWEGLRQVYATLLGARHVPERLCGGPWLQRGTITSVRPLPFTLLTVYSTLVHCGREGVQSDGLYLCMYVELLKT